MAMWPTRLTLWIGGGLLAAFLALVARQAFSMAGWLVVSIAAWLFAPVAFLLLYGWARRRASRWPPEAQVTTTKRLVLRVAGAAMFAATAALLLFALRENKVILAGLGGLFTVAVWLPWELLFLGVPEGLARDGDEEPG